MKKEETFDMPGEEFRSAGIQMINWIADYLENIDSLPVVSKNSPGDLKNQIPQSPPSSAEDFEKIFKDIDNLIIPALTHWNHPGFMAYFNSTSSAPGILAELLCAALNSNALTWKTSPASTELEISMLNWLKEMTGIPENFFGVVYDTASTSTLHAIAAAREAASGSVRTEGLFNSRRMIVYASEQAHFSVEKAIITLGLGLNSFKKIKTDSQFKMIPRLLLEEIKKDKESGNLPVCVVATIGTTSTTSIDPLKEIAEICSAENVWLHIDAAQAGISAILPERKFIFEGIENADSIVMNPHKWMFVPVDISTFFIKDHTRLKNAFSVVKEYLTAEDNPEAVNFMDYGFQLGRRFRSLKLWFVIRYFGVDGLRRIIRQHLRLAENFAAWIDAHPMLDRIAEVHFSTVCFRFKPGNLTQQKINDLNDELLKLINSSGKIFLSSTILNGNFIIRLSMSGIRSTEAILEKAKEIISESVETINKIVRS
jgi:aromatic-L-amino-acid/L-tryptophan decarboxylase